MRSDSLVTAQIVLEFIKLQWHYHAFKLHGSIIYTFKGDWKYFLQNRFHISFYASLVRKKKGGGQHHSICVCQYRELRENAKACKSFSLWLGAGDFFLKETLLISLTLPPLITAVTYHFPPVHEGSENSLKSAQRKEIGAHFWSKAFIFLCSLLLCSARQTEKYIHTYSHFRTHIDPFISFTALNPWINKSSELSKLCSYLTNWGIFSIRWFSL